MVFFIVMLLTVFVLPAEKVVMEQLLNPGGFYIDTDRMYVIEGVDISIYSLKDFTLMKKFGKKGEGPDEFLASPQTGGLAMFVLPDSLMINSQGKISFFTKDGKFVKALKTTKQIGVFLPLKDQYAAMTFAVQDELLYATFNIYDSNFEKVKEFYRQKNFYQHRQGGKMNPLLGMPFIYTDGDDLIIIQTYLKGDMLVYNGKGEKIRTISYDYEPVKVTDENKKAILHFYQTDPRIRDNWPILKDRIEFPATFPEIEQIEIDLGKIYARTNRMKDDKNQFIIFDLKTGKYIKDVYLPFARKSVLEPYPFAIKDNKFYQMVENLDTEKWELLIFPIE